MRARDIMTPNPVTVASDVPVRVAAAMLRKHAITSMPVVDAEGQVIGMVSEMDLLRGRLPHDPRASLRARSDGPDPGRTVGEVMTDTVICMPDGADAADLAQAMVVNHIRAVPILRGGDLVGIVSRRDVLKTLLRDDSAIRADAMERLTEYEPDASRWDVEVTEGVITVTGHIDDDKEKRLIQALLRTVPGAVRVHVQTRRSTG